MVCRKVRETSRGTSRRGPSGQPVGHPACRPRRFRRFFLDTGMRPVSNACSGTPGGVPDDEINAHLGNPGLENLRWFLAKGAPSRWESSMSLDLEADAPVVEGGTIALVVLRDHLEEADAPRAGLEDAEAGETTRG